MDKEEKLSEKEALRERENNKKALEAIDLVVLGKNDTFKKDYILDELGLAIHVSVKYPNIRQQAKVEALRSDFLGGTAQDYYTNRRYETLFIINELGKNTKVFLLDEDGNETDEIEDYFSLDGYARPDVINIIADDLLVWMGRFRG